MRNVTEGQILALPVTNDRGVVVVQKGISLGESLVERLKHMGVQRIFVEEPGFTGIDCQEGLDSATYSQLGGFLRRMVEAVQSSTGANLSRFAKELYTWTETILGQLENGSPSFLLYPNEGDAIHRWTAHVVNVALLGARTFLNIDGRDQARHIITAALLQDLGLWRLGDEALLLNSYITGNGQADQLQQHVAYSSRLTHTIPGLSSYVKAIVAQHHENCDGTGYPKALVSEAIHPLSKVMAVVDAYVTQTQREKDPLLPHDALEWLMAGVGVEFDHVAVRAFRNAVFPYPAGIEVELNSKERGVVTGVRGALATRPNVRVLWDADGQPTEPYYEVDLAQETTKSIQRIL